MDSQLDGREFDCRQVVPGTNSTVREKKVFGGISGAMRFQ